MDALYELLLKEIYRLKGKISEIELHSILTEFVYQRLSVSDFSKIAGKDYISSITLPGGLSKEPILRITLKMLHFLQAAATWDDFIKIEKKIFHESDLDELIEQILKSK